MYAIYCKGPALCMLFTLNGQAAKVHEEAQNKRDERDEEKMSVCAPQRTEQCFLVNFQDELSPIYY